MKHPISILAFLLLPILCFSQGIKFEQGSWKDALALAKQTNKPLCLYVYSSKPMDDFLQSETVGNVYNAFFINYKVDMKTKEGLELANKYQVKTQPILLYFNPDGILISQKTIGPLAVSINEYTDWARKVLLEVKNPKPITAWEAEYPQKKNDPAFVKEYLDKLRDLNLPFKEVVDQYFRLILTTDSMSVYNALLFQNLSNQLMVTDDAYKYFIKNREKYQIVLADHYGRAVDFDDNWVFQTVVNRTINEAVRLKDEALLKTAVDAFRQIPYTTDMKQPEEFYMDYYKGTGEMNKYLDNARLFYEEQMRRLDSEALLVKDNKAKKRLEKQLERETDPAKIQSITKSIKSLASLEISQICTKLNSIAYYVLNNFSDPAILNEALVWSNKTIELSPNTTFYLDASANILYKLGRKEEAIKMEKQAVANFQGSPTYKRFDDTLKKMEAGEKMW